MQIHWFSPLPPVDVPAAACTAAVVPYLARTASIVLWTAQAAWDPGLERYARVRKYSMRRFPWLTLNRGDLAVFNLGKEAEHHGTIWRLLQAHSGIAVVHDAQLHELYLQAPHPVSGEDPGYVAECERFYGSAGRLAGEIFRGGLCPAARMAEQFPMFEPVLEAASGVMVNDRALAGRLARQTGFPAVHVSNPLAEGGSPDEFVRALLRLAAAADSGYATSLVMAQRIAHAMKQIVNAQVREAALDRAADAVCSLTTRRRG